MKELDLLALARQGWISNPDPVVSASMEYMPEIENFAPTFENSLVLEQGYTPSGLDIDPMADNKAIVCLLPFELSTGISTVVYGGGGKLYIEEIVSTPESDNQAAGKIV